MKTLSKLAGGLMVATVLVNALYAQRAAGLVDPYQDPIVVGTDGAPRAAGLLIYVESGLTPDQYASVTEFTSAEIFSTVVNLTTIDGGKLSVENRLVHGRIDYLGKRPEAFPEILQEKDIAPIEAAMKNLDGVNSHFPKSRKYLGPLIAELKQEIERFRKGQGKWNGRWYATLKMAVEERDRPLRLAAAEGKRQAELNRAMAAEMEVTAKKAAAEREAALDAETMSARAFQKSATALFGRFLDAPSWKGRGENLSKITPLSPELKFQIQTITEAGKTMQSRLVYPEAQTICEKTFPMLNAAAAWSLAAESFAAGEAAKGTAALQSFLSHNSAAANPELSPVWDPLLTFFKSCRNREEVAQSHLHAARELSAVGKNSQAIKEYETAQSLFPNREIAPAIEKLRKDSLGL